MSTILFYTVYSYISPLWPFCPIKIPMGNASMDSHINRISSENTICIMISSIYFSYLMFTIFCMWYDYRTRFMEGQQRGKNLLAKSISDPRFISAAQNMVRFPLGLFLFTSLCDEGPPAERGIERNS